MLFFFFFNDTATTEIYTLSLHDALPILCVAQTTATSPFSATFNLSGVWGSRTLTQMVSVRSQDDRATHVRSEEHTSELQSRQYLVCRLLLEKKKKTHVISILYVQYIMEI